MKKLNSNKGITLIALVITIIILLILAGVTISAIVGENGIINKSTTSKEETSKATALEELKLVVSDLQISESIDGLDSEEKRKKIQEGLQKYDLDSKVECAPSGDGYVVIHKGTEYEISGKLEVSVAFNEEEWDEKATPEDVFVWASDDSESEDYGTIIGYTKNVQNYTTLRIPSRCTKINENSWSVFDLYDEHIDTIRGFTKNIKEIELPETIVEISREYYNFSSVNKINIPNSCKIIGKNAFLGFRNLTSIAIPDNVTNIGESAFNSCSSLTSIIIPNSITSIEKAAFLSCSSLTSVTIPDNITSIEKSVFGGCSSLKSITIPDSVTSIGESAFNYCSSLTSMTISGNVTTIASNAFYNCSSLKMLIIEDGIINIGYNSFMNCKSLENITIPESVISMGDYAFKNISATATFNVIQGSYADTWLQNNKESTQTINYITK